MDKIELEKLRQEGVVRTKRLVEGLQIAFTELVAERKLSAFIHSWIIHVAFERLTLFVFLKEGCDNFETRKRFYELFGVIYYPFFDFCLFEEGEMEWTAGDCRRRLEDGYIADYIYYLNQNKEWECADAPLEAEKELH